MRFVGPNVLSNASLGFATQDDVCSDGGRNDFACPNDTVGIPLIGFRPRSCFSSTSNASNSHLGNPTTLMNITGMDGETEVQGLLGPHSGGSGDHMMTPKPSGVQELQSPPLIQPSSNEVGDLLFFSDIRPPTYILLPDDF
jgi:hypothetical protein